LEGVSGRTFTPTKTREEIEANEFIYMLTQKQRYYERQIRAAKTECYLYDEALKSALNDTLRRMYKDDFNSAAIKLKRREAALLQFLAEHPELNRQREREWKSVFGHSVSMKAVWAYRKS
jgi:DNA-binding response OmpR family regulator